MNLTLEPIAISLFSGAGGLSLGLQKAGWEIIFANDFDKWAVITYKNNFPKTQVTLCDVRAINFAAIKGVTLVAGGPPCQPFSVAGKQEAQNDPRDMVPEFIRAITEIKPIAFLFENVQGLATKKHRDYLNWVFNTFIKLGYSIYSRVVDAADYGVPQHRNRLLIVGFLGNYSFSFPNPTHGPNGEQEYISAGEALIGTPIDDPNLAKIIYATKPVLRPSPYAGMLVNGQGRPINLSRPSPTIPATAGGYRTHILDQNGVLLKYHKYLRASGQPEQGEVKEVRRITANESARLQSFPDDFVFRGPKSVRYKLIGNAVPPLLSYAIGKAIYNALFLENVPVRESTLPTQLRLM